MGCDVVAFSSTEEKREEALKLGANEFYATKGIEDYSLLGLKKPVDRLLITTSAKLDIGIFYPILNRNATIVPLSVDGGNFTAPYFPTVYHGQRIIGSCVCSQFLQYVWLYENHIGRAGPWLILWLQRQSFRLCSAKQNLCRCWEVPHDIRRGHSMCGKTS